MILLISALEGLLEGTTSAATMETTLGDLLPSLLAASANWLASSGREDSYQQHTSSLTDTDEEFSSAVAGKGTLQKTTMIFVILEVMFVSKTDLTNSIVLLLSFYVSKICLFLTDCTSNRVTQTH